MPEASIKQRENHASVSLSYHERRLLCAEHALTLFVAVRLRAQRCVLSVAPLSATLGYDEAVDALMVAAPS